jgi:hypothetical protein
MRPSIRTIYTGVDPDYATVLMGYFTETPLYCNLLKTELTEPITTDTIMLFEPPADINADDYIEASVTATPGNTTTNTIEETFTYIQTKSFRFAGIVSAYVNATIDLDQVGNDGGAATIESILVELLKYDIDTEITTQIGIDTHANLGSVAGIITESAYVEPSLSELFTFNVGVASPIEIGLSSGTLLQMRVKITFSAYSPADQLVDTIAKCHLNCYRNKSKSTYLQLAVV